MQTIGKRLAVVVVLWLLLCAMVLGTALPAAGYEMISQADIHIISAWTEKKEGIVSVSVEFITQFPYDPGNLLWITVSCGGQSCAMPLKKNSPEEVSCVTLSGCVEPDLVRVEINGFRRDRDGNLIPVRGRDEAPVEGDRYLKLHIEKGETWNLYLVGELWELLNGYLILNPEPTPEEVEIYAITGNLITTWLGLEDGEISWNMTDCGYPDGVYLLLEEGSGEAFYVTVPKVNADGTLVSCVVDTSE